MCYLGYKTEDIQYTVGHIYLKLKMFSCRYKFGFSTYNCYLKASASVRSPKVRVYVEKNREHKPKPGAYSLREYT